MGSQVSFIYFCLWYLTSKRKFTEAHPQSAKTTRVLNASKWIEHYKNLNTPIKASLKSNKTRVVDGDKVEFTLTIVNDSPQTQQGKSTTLLLSS
jgi:hypothetical protein